MSSFETQINWWGKLQKTITYDENTLKVVHTSHGFPGWKGIGHQLDYAQIKNLQNKGYRLIASKEK